MTHAHPVVYPANFLNDDGTLRLVTWALRDQTPQLTLDVHYEKLMVKTSHELPARMAHSTATGKGLLSNGDLGVDLIRIGARQAFVPHTHPGDHLLIVIGGSGTITYDGRIYETKAGQVYMVPGHVPHAVGAITDHVILAVGSPHKAVDDDSRMAPMEYQDVLADTGALLCTICNVSSQATQLLHEAGCVHCPCPWCVTTGDAAEDSRLRNAWLGHP